MRYDGLSRASMIAAAESFADVTALEQHCYDYTHAGIEAITSTAHGWLTDYFRFDLAKADPELKQQHIHAVVHVALQELHYPPRPYNDDKPYLYAWSGRQRAASAGMSRSTWSRLNLCHLTYGLIQEIEKQSKQCTAKVRRQMAAES